MELRHTGVVMLICTCWSHQINTEETGRGAIISNWVTEVHLPDIVANSVYGPPFIQFILHWFSKACTENFFCVKPGPSCPRKIFECIDHLQEIVFFYFILFF